MLQTAENHGEGVLEESCWGLMEDGLQSGEEGRGTSQEAATPVLVSHGEGWGRKQELFERYSK